MSAIRIYFRVLHYARAYWRQISLSIGATVFFSIFSGASIYLFIPLLDVLFHPERTAAGTHSAPPPLPFGLGPLFAGARDAFFGAVFSGSQLDALFRICV